MLEAPRILPLPAPEPQLGPEAEPEAEKGAFCFSARGFGCSLWHYLTKAGSAAKELATRPVLVGSYNINWLSASGGESSDPLLRRIGHAANEGLRRAALRGAQGTDAAAHLHEEFDRRLQVETTTVDTTATMEAGPVVKTIGDPEVTRAPALREQADAVDWKQRTDQNCEALCKEVSALAALTEMHKFAGISERSSVALQRLAGRAMKPTETQSLWQLFVEQYELSLWQKFCAGLAYWLYYKTSLITNTVNAYIEAFLSRLQEDLTTADSRSKFIHTALEQANAFLVEDLRATTAFAHSTTPGEGDLEKFRTGAIESPYQGDLTSLCQRFSRKRIEQDSPRVRFFRSLQRIPGLGSIARLFEWAINRFIIQKIMKSLILPSTLESAIKDGVKATEPSNIAFSLALIRFINAQLEKLQRKLQDKTTPPSQPKVLPGTELLPTVIKHLLLVLELEPLGTQPELRRKLKEMEERPGFVDQMVGDSLQAGTLTAGHHLIQYLDHSAHSSELFAHMLELARAPFSSQHTDQAILLAQFAAEQKALNRAARKVAETIIHNEVSNLVGGVPAEKAVQDTQRVFASGQTVLKRTFEELQKICTEIGQKIEREEHRPDEQNNVKHGIATALQLIQLLATRAELQSLVDQLPLPQRQMVWHSFHPLLKKAAELAETLLLMQEHQADYLTDQAVSAHLEAIHGHITHFSSDLCHTLQKLSEQVESALTPRAPAVVHLKRLTQQVFSLSQKIVNEQRTLEALFALCPFAENPAAPQPQQKGLVEQLLDSEAGISPPGFQPSACRAAIQAQLACFADNAAREKEELLTLLDSGASVAEKRRDLTLLFQRIWERHTALRVRDEGELQSLLQTTATWVEDKRSKYNRTKDEDLREMKQLSQAISADAALLYCTAKEMQLSLPFSLTSGEMPLPLVSIQKKTLMGGAVGAAAGSGLVKGLGAGLGAVGAWLGGEPGRQVGNTVGSALGAGMGSAGFIAVPNASGLLSKNPAAIATTVTSFVLGATLSFVAPTLSTVIGAASLAWTGIRWQHIAHTNAREKVLPRVTSAFDQATNFLASSRIYKALATRGLKAATEA